MIQQNKKLLQNLDLVIGLRRAEALHLTCSISTKDRIIKDLEDQLKIQERLEKQANNDMNSLSQEVGAITDWTMKVEYSLHDQEHTVEAMQEEVDTLTAMVEELTQNM